MNTPNRLQNHDRVPFGRRVRVVAALAITLAGMGAAYFLQRNEAPRQHNATPVVWSLDQIHSTYPAANDVLRVDRNNQQDRLLIVGATQEKVGDDIFLTTNGGKTWTELKPDPNSGIQTGQYVVDAEFGPQDGQGNQTFEVTREGTKGDMVSVQVGSITDEGSVRTNTASAPMDVASTRGTWTQQADNSWYFTLWSDKGGGPEVEDLGIGEPLA